MGDDQFLILLIEGNLVTPTETYLFYRGQFNNSTKNKDYLTIKSDGFFFWKLKGFIKSPFKYLFNSRKYEYEYKFTEETIDVSVKRRNSK